MRLTSIRTLIPILISILPLPSSLTLTLVPSAQYPPFSSLSHPNCTDILLIMLPTDFKTRKPSRHPHTYPNAMQVKDAYAQYTPTPTFPSSTSASGSNNIPIATPEEIQARRNPPPQPTHQETQDRRDRLLTPAVGREGKGDGISRYHGTLYRDVGGYKVPIPPPPGIEGRVVDENKESADLLRLMMEDDEVMSIEVSWLVPGGISGQS